MTRRRALWVCAALWLVLAPPRRAQALRVASCIVGQVRTLALTYETLGDEWARKFPLGDGVEARDLFLYLDTNCNPWGCDTSRLDEWISFMAPVASDWYNETYEDWKDVVPESNCEIPSRRGSMDSGYWHQHEKLRRCYALVTAHEQKMGWKYDYVAKLRADLKVDTMNIKTTDLRPERIFSADKCHVMQPVGDYAHGPLCDMLFVVPRRWSDIVFSAVKAWTTCRNHGANGSPCHVPSWQASGGTPGECILTGWLVDNHIDPSTFEELTEEQVRLGIIKISTVTASPPPPKADAAPAVAAALAPAAAELEKTERAQQEQHANELDFERLKNELEQLTSQRSSLDLEITQKEEALQALKGRLDKPATEPDAPGPAVVPAASLDGTPAGTGSAKEHALFVEEERNEDARHAEASARRQIKNRKGRRSLKKRKRAATSPQ